MHTIFTLHVLFNCSNGSVKQALPQFADEINLEKFLSNSKETPIPQLQKAVQISKRELNLDYRRIEWLDKSQPSSENSETYSHPWKAAFPITSSRQNIWLPVVLIILSKSMLASRLPQYHRYLLYISNSSQTY